MYQEKLNELKNITLKMYDVEAAEEGFHTKGYIFKKDEVYRIIIGSSNITKSALTSNREWNTKIVSTEQGEEAVEILEEYKTDAAAPGNMIGNFNYIDGILVWMFITEDVKKISVQTIIIWGTNDLTVSIDNAYEIEKLIKDSAVIPYEGLSHFAYLENKNQTISIIDSFIK